jgi:mannose-6-phosphate isomerase-like protein (cupin superfamily)
MTHVLNSNQMLAVRAGYEHRARSKGVTTLLVIAAIKER